MYYFAIVTIVAAVVVWVVLLLSLYEAWLWKKTLPSRDYNINGWLFVLALFLASFLVVYYTRI